MPLNIKPMITRYAPIDTEESTTNDSAVTSHKNATVCFTLRTVFIYHVVWLLIATAVVVSTGTWPQFSNYPTCFPFRKEDFVPARSSIHVQDIVFTEAATFNRTESPPRIYRDDIPSYVGDPNPALDQRWDELLDDQYFYISEQDAKDAWGNGYQKYWKDDNTNSYRAGLGVFHSLHCLNILRKEIYKDHYRHRTYEGLIAELQKYHVDHCIDMIRQSIQCSADLSPIPVIWYDPITGKQSVDSEHTHTCRDIDAIRDWVTLRVEDSRALQQDIVNRAMAGMKRRTDKRRGE